MLRVHRGSAPRMTSHRYDPRAWRAAAWTLAMLWVVLLLAMAPSRVWALQERTAKQDVLHTHMSTKTVYPTPPSSLASTRDHPQCHVVQLNYVVRHGTRFPTEKDLTRIAQTKAKLQRLLQMQQHKTKAPPPALQWLSTWSDPYRSEDAGLLADVGVHELVAMGRRLRQRFGDTLAPHFQHSAYAFSHTFKLRTMQSATAFAYGFFDGHQPVSYKNPPPGEDAMLRFFDNCPAFDASVQRNKTAMQEFHGYRQSMAMQTNLRRFQAMAGDVNGRLLTQKDLEAAYAACAFDVAVRGQEHEWCALFDAEMLLSMDYFHDLKHFYRKGHGHALAHEIATPLLQDVFHTLHTRVKALQQEDGAASQATNARDRGLDGVFRFAHAETVLPLASLLNLSSFDSAASQREGHFRADTTLALAQTRGFRGSTLAPFAGNIGFVLYDCGGHENDGEEEEREKEEHGGATAQDLKAKAETARFRVETLLHERSVAFDACGGRHLCPLETFERMLTRWIYDYDFAHECGV